MRIVVTLEQRYHQSGDGTVWTEMGGDYRFWTRYLEVFSEVIVVARVLSVGRIPEGLTRADGPGVSFAPVPHYIGPWQYLSHVRKTRRAIRSAIGHGDAVILRIPSQIAADAHTFLRESRHPYAVEVIGDPHDVFSPGAVRHFLRPFFRWWFCRKMRIQCAGACAAAYVTREALQKKYPCPSFTQAISDVDLPADSFSTSYPNEDTCPGGSAGSRSAVSEEGRPFRVVFVGTLEQYYKAPDVLLEAVGRCIREGIDLELTIVGDGKHRRELESLSVSLGISPRVCFTGWLPPGDAVRAELDRSDLFVLPSRTEGLPRALLEAMARSLPCIGSTVGGIPELLSPEDLVPPGDARALAAKLREVLLDPGRRSRMSSRNLAVAREYREEVLREKRVAFYLNVPKMIEDWRESNCPSVLSI